MRNSNTRAARDQTLPDSEVATLRKLDGLPLWQHCSDLYDAGWTLRSIGEAFSPVRPRSTVRSWIQKLGNPHGPRQTNVPAPTLRTETEYVPKRPVSPGIPPSDLHQIQELAPVSRKFRSGMSPQHKAALANADLTRLVSILHDRGVPVQELADAAGVTYRAMAKRLGKA